MMTSILKEDRGGSDPPMPDSVTSLLLADHLSLGVQGVGPSGRASLSRMEHCPLSSGSDASFDEDDEVDCDDEEDDDDDDCNSAASDSSSHGPCLMSKLTQISNGSSMVQTQQHCGGLVAASVNGGGYGQHFFEGAEKRLALYLSPTTAKSVEAEANGEAGSSVAPDLRKVSRLSWEKVLDQVNCRILNVISNDHLDAYLLSESSMFVSKNRVILKTCGTTTLLHCLERILQLVNKAGFDLIEDVFYSHKNLLVPSLQLHPHDSFRKESQYLDKVFNGFAHLFGHLNSDHWYLYTLDNRSQSGSDDDEEEEDDDVDVDELKVSKAGQNLGPKRNIANMSGKQMAPLWPGELARVGNDHFKFEMIMEELSPKVMNYFVRSQLHAGVTAAEVTRKSGIDSLIPGMQIDDYLFTPCGYSMNGLLAKHYMTIHITPEPDFSYVSVETDLPQACYLNLIGKLIHTFKPGKFQLNLMEPCKVDSDRKSDQGKQQQLQQSTGNQTGEPDDPESADASALNLYEELHNSGPTGAFADYRQCELQMMHYKHCDLVFARYVAEGIS